MIKYINFIWDKVTNVFKPKPKKVERPKKARRVKKIKR